ncbi:MAG: alkaline phosphatase family protein [Opitutae bacterium]|nr:alkaline phosphatase family protein [Opitutae bacterium]
MQRYYSTGFLLFPVIFLLQPSLPAYYPEDLSRPLTSIAFGSCNRETLPQPMWGVILAAKPDLWIWGGDNVYGNSSKEAILRQTYEKQLSQKDYQIFRDSLPIIGIWDDHDYGQNNTGKWFKTKAASQQLLLDFLDEPKESPRRRQRGIYTSYDFGPPGKRVKILLIDNRYHADRPGPEGDLLGQDQWDWLESELASSRAQFNLIVSGIQFLSEEHPYEKWANFPKSQNRLLDFIRKEKISGVLFLSGDRHFHEISRKDDGETPYPLVDITSSGLTHPMVSFSGEPNRYRLGQVFNQKGFGLIKINWRSPNPEIHLQIRDQENQIRNELKLTLGDLRPSS